MGTGVVVSLQQVPSSFPIIPFPSLSPPPPPHVQVSPLSVSTVEGTKIERSTAGVPINKLDSKKCSQFATILGGEKVSVQFTATGCVLAERGYCEGTHHWEFTAAKMGNYSWCGVSTSPPADLNDWIGNQSTGFAISGFETAGVCPAYHAGAEFHGQLPFYTSGDRVGFTLYCRGGGCGGERTTLEYIRNGTKVAVLDFDGKLTGLTLFPAFSTLAYSLPAEYTNITFDS
eukprot:TRINITY_DN1158_c0_g1_i2.p1 TRINITY_DN1158_c0_g1~~TRINITY_DN1158_c0_g1_i2.p1  ORF type:complete len:245 (-),score=74.10 TRINITY_DN1158_c0_g1_i2:241-930(-)